MKDKFVKGVNVDFTDRQKVRQKLIKEIYADIETQLTKIYHNEPMKIVDDHGQSLDGPNELVEKDSWSKAVRFNTNVDGTLVTQIINVLNQYGNKSVSPVDPKSKVRYTTASVKFNWIHSLVDVGGGIATHRQIYITPYVDICFSIEASTYFRSPGFDRYERKRKKEEKKYG